MLSMAGSGQLASAIAAISVLPVCPPSLAQTPSLAQARVPLHVRAQITVAVQLLLQLLTVARCPIMPQSLCCSMCACVLCSAVLFQKCQETGETISNPLSTESV